MKFLQLNIENFLAITSAQIQMADRGLVLVQGVNEADTSANSNGAGKSSIADALCWAIYGTTARGESGDAVVNIAAAKNTRVDVRIQDDSGVYRIVRHRKHKSGKNALHVFLDNGFGESDLTKGTDKLTQEVVDRIIGASHEVFTGSIYAGQEKMPDLPALTDKMLKILIEEAAGITTLEAAYQKARENVLAAKSNLTFIETKISATQTSIQATETRRQDFENTNAQWHVSQSQSVKEMEDRARNVLFPEIKSLTDPDRVQKVADLKDLIDTATAKIAGTKDEHDNLERLRQTQVNAAMGRTRVNEDLRRNEITLKQAQSEVNGAQSRLGQPCTSCGRPLTEHELDTVITAGKKKVSDLIDAEQTLLTTLQAAESDYTAATAAVSTFQQGMTDVSATAAQRQEYEAELASLTAAEARRADLTKQARDLVDQINLKKAEVSPYVAQIAALDANLVKLRAELDTDQKERDARVEKLAVETEVSKVFSPAGVRARILDGVTPYLNGQTGKYLAILTDGNISAEWSTLTVSKGGQVKERFAIDVTSVSSSATFKGLSGGEKRKVRVATALALQDLVSTRAAKPIDLFIGDEIDHALDASGLERLMTILEEKARERGTVMVISHNSLKEEIKNVITVRRTKSGETQISETAA